MSEKQRWWKERSTGHITQADRMPFPRFTGDYWDECDANGDPLTNEGEPMSEIDPERYKQNYALLSQPPMPQPSDPLTAAPSNPHEAAWAKTRVPQQPSEKRYRHKNYPNTLSEADRLELIQERGYTPESFQLAQPTDYTKQEAINGPENKFVPHQPPDQQWSEAVAVTDKHYAFWDWIKPYLYDAAGKIKMSADEFEQKIATMFPDQSAAIAERDRTIAELRDKLDATEASHSDEEAAHADTLRLLELRDATIAELRDKLKIPHPARDFVNECNTALTAKNKQITALQARVRELEGTFKRILEWDCLHPEPLQDLCEDLPWLKRLIEDALRPTTEK